MTKRLLLLNGLAILMVPFHHSTSYGLQAMFFWTNRYRPVSVPNYDQIGTLPYYIIMAIRQLDAYAIPAFFFVSGFFVAFMARGTPLTWKAIMPRLKVLLIPFIIWTIIRFLLLRDVPHTAADVLDPYYFIALLFQFYLLAPIMVWLAKINWKFVLLITLAIQLSLEIFSYLPILGVESPVLSIVIYLTPRWFAPSRIFYFTLGVVAGLYMQPFKEWLARMRWVLVVIVIVSAILSFVEYELVAYLTGQVWLGPNNPGIARIVYASTFSLCFLAFPEFPIPYADKIAQLGTKSLGIYLVNTPAIFPMAVAMYHLTPWVLGNQLIYQTVLVVVGIGVPLLLMELVRLSPARVGYRYLFG